MKKSLGAKTFVFPTPVFIIGSYDDQERPNIMTAAWAGICCSHPASMAVSLREATYTHGNIVRHKAFTINVPSVSHVKEADYVGTCSGRDKDKFVATGLTPVKSELVNAPYVKEFPLIVECQLTHTIELGLHTQFIGEILDVKVDEDVLDDKGMPDVARVDPFIFAPGSQGYHRVGEFIGQAFVIGTSG